MKNLSRLEATINEIVGKLRLSDDWRISEAYRVELLRQVASESMSLANAAYALNNEINEELENQQ